MIKEIIFDNPGRTRHQRTIRLKGVNALPPDARIAFLKVGVDCPISILFATVISSKEWRNFKLYSASNLCFQPIGPSFLSMLELVKFYLNRGYRVITSDNHADFLEYAAKFIKSGYSEIPPVRLGEKRARRKKCSK